MNLNFAKEQIVQRIIFDNPWWQTGHIEPFYQTMKPRLYFYHFHSLVKQLEPRRAIVLMGPRRVGKTVMIFHAINELIKKGVSPRRIVYLSVETPIYSGMGLEMFLRTVQESIFNTPPPDEHWYFFFDEIQYLKNWEVHLKSLVDSYKNVKFVVSGSAAAALKLKSVESGAGRFTDFMLPPLTFNEFIMMKGLNHLIKEVPLNWGGNSILFYGANGEKELNEQFIEYINYGGYPEVIFNNEIRKDPKRYIRHDIIDKVLLRDLPSLYGIMDVQELNTLFTMLAYNTGNEFTLEGISKSSGGVKKNTLKKYLEYLEAAFLLKTVKRIDKGAKKFQRNNFFKIYLTNPSLRSALFSPLPSTDDKMGNLVETAIMAQWLHRDWHVPYYARWKNGEVDMVGLKKATQKPSWAVEIKWSNRFFQRPKELKNLIQFCKQHGLENTMVTTIDKAGNVEIDGVTIHFLPAAAYAYTVGRRTFERKME